MNVTHSWRQWNVSFFRGMTGSRIIKRSRTWFAEWSPVPLAGADERTLFTDMGNEGSIEMTECDISLKNLAREMTKQNKCILIRY